MSCQKEEIQRGKFNEPAFFFNFSLDDLFVEERGFAPEVRVAGNLLFLVDLNNQAIFGYTLFGDLIGIWIPEKKLDNWSETGLKEEFQNSRLVKPLPLSLFFDVVVHNDSLLIVTSEKLESISKNGSKVYQEDLIIKEFDFDGNFLKDFPRKFRINEEDYIDKILSLFGRDLFVSFENERGFNLFWFNELDQKGEEYFFAKTMLPPQSPYTTEGAIFLWEILGLESEGSESILLKGIVLREEKEGSLENLGVSDVAEILYSLNIKTEEFTLKRVLYDVNLDSGSYRNALYLGKGKGGDSWFYSTDADSLETSLLKIDGGGGLETFAFSPKNLITTQDDFLRFSQSGLYLQLVLTPSDNSLYQLEIEYRKLSFFRWELP